MSSTFVSWSALQFSLQSLSPLTSCLASILNGTRCVKPVSKNNGLRNNETKSELLRQSLNHEAFHSVLSEVKQLLCDERYTKLKFSEFLAQNPIDIKCDQRVTKVLTNKILRARKDPLNHWITSHSSHWSFDHNKHRPDKASQIRLFSYWMTSVSGVNYNQIRSFKSRGTFTGIGNSRDRDRLKDETSLGHKKLGSIFGIKKDKNPLYENEKMKEYINEEHLNNEEKDRIKIAFAEGYLAAEPKSRTSSKMKFFNIFRDLMGIVLIIAILFSFMVDQNENRFDYFSVDPNVKSIYRSKGGSFRRVLIGGSNEVHPEDIDVTFDDVKGIEEAKQELQEIVEFLKDPEKFSILGGKLPKGVLLVGPPGTGKTLLARAVAGEAGVPFFHAAGPEFDEILVGQGARRVRDLFSTAKLKAPCVVFIDEIDSVGAKRSNSVLHPYANQTINQLLTEMDGFRQNEGVIVLGATNRRDDLDKALLRPGRFDVEVQVPVPDFHGRKEILELYLSKVKYSNDVDIDVLSRGTTGFTGADIENMVNQAALRAAIDGQSSVNMKYLENSRDKVLMGPERKSRIPDEEANIITAYHEGGHALVAHFTRDAAPLHKVTIVPRGPSLGHTAYLPDKERFYTTKSQILAQLDTAMGGRAAEELIFGNEKITTGAYDDLRNATNLATHMVKNLGMSDKVGFALWLLSNRPKHYYLGAFDMGNPFSALKPNQFHLSKT